MPLKSNSQVWRPDPVATAKLEFKNPKPTSDEKKKLQPLKNSSEIWQPTSKSFKPQTTKSLLEKFGISLLLADIMKFKKKIVGHYCVLDLTYMYSTFISQKLPATFKDFSLSLTTYFPSIIDTKMLVSFPCMPIDKKLPRGLKNLYDYLKSYSLKLVNEESV